jgi:F-type H+-transporting ATPase subunit delta
VTLDLKIDPALLGGLKIKVGSRLIDASLQGQLKRLHLALAGRA